MGLISRLMCSLIAKHQRNIVDDVLSFSKLDASMLSLSPKACLPGRQIANSLKLFQPEFRRQEVEFDYRIDQSYLDLDVSWVLVSLLVPTSLSLFMFFSVSCFLSLGRDL